MKTLTQNMMESGKRFVQLLDDNNAKPKAAFWIYNPELDDWQLLAGHVNSINDDSEKFNETVTAILSSNRSQLPELQVTDIGLALSSAPILELLNAVVNTGDEILGINFTREEINDIVIDGVYLYRMNITEWDT
jgi:hypothetical protein